MYFTPDTFYCTQSNIRNRNKINMASIIIILKRIKGLKLKSTVVFNNKFRCHCQVNLAKFNCCNMVQTFYTYTYTYNNISTLTSVLFSFVVY